MKSPVILSWQDDESGQTEFVQFDAVVTEVHEDIVTITDHPVELGVNITDHARPEPERLTVEGIVSRMPNPELDSDLSLDITELSVQTMVDQGTRTIVLRIPQPPIEPSINGLVNAGIGALKNAIFGAPKATVENPPIRGTVQRNYRAIHQTEPRDRVRDIYDLLLKAKERALLVVVSTTPRDYYDMLIERIAAPRTVDDGGGRVRFEVDLRRIRVAASETVNAPEPAEARGQPTKAKGSQASKQDPNDEKKKERLESTLHKAKEAAAEALNP